MIDQFQGVVVVVFMIIFLISSGLKVMYCVKPYSTSRFNGI